METKKRTGVSRFGRLRKKPSKLMDFQSYNPDNEHNVSNTKKRKTFSQTEYLLPIEFVELPSNTTLKLEMFNEDLTDEETDSSSSVGDYSENLRDVTLHPLNGKPTTKIFKNMKMEMFNEDLTDEETDSSSSVGDYSENLRDVPWHPLNGKPTNKILKDGKLKTSKPHRLLHGKYKRKKRYTGYMVWAKNIRSELLSANPELDFISVSRKLGQMWANVPPNEKYNYRQSAKRLSPKAKNNSAVIIVQTVQNQLKL